GRLQDVHEALVRADLELLARLAVDVRTAQDGVAFDPRRQRDRPVDHRPGSLRGVNDLEGGAIQHLMVVTFHADANPFVGEAGHEVTPSDSPTRHARCPTKSEPVLYLRPQTLSSRARDE